MRTIEMKIVFQFFCFLLISIVVCQQPQIVVYYSFDNVQETNQVMDDSGNGNHCSLRGFENENKNEVFHQSQTARPDSNGNVMNFGSQQNYKKSCDLGIF